VFIGAIRGKTPPIAHLINETERLCGVLVLPSRSRVVPKKAAG
jgi:hypothetical protein